MINRTCDRHGWILARLTPDPLSSIEMRWVLAILLLVGCSRPVPKLELVDAPVTPDEVTLISSEVARAVHDGKRLVVYVGASWCEPCTRFHDAAKSGALDATFGDVRMLVFDADRDTDALANAGYVSQMIPLFALPRNDGRSSTRQIEGSIKGEGAVGEITPRLRTLLETP